MRKIIQIACAGVENTQHTQANYIRLVLCDDGSVWESDDQRPAWNRLPDIPQTGSINFSKDGFPDCDAICKNCGEKMEDHVASDNRCPQFGGSLNSTFEPDI